GVDARAHFVIERLRRRHEHAPLTARLRERERERALARARAAANERELASIHGVTLFVPSRSASQRRTPRSMARSTQPPTTAPVAVCLPAYRVGRSPPMDRVQVTTVQSVPVPVAARPLLRLGTPDSSRTAAFASVAIALASSSASSDRGA